MKKIVILCLILILSVCSVGFASEIRLPIPQMLQNQSFIYDELESGTGTDLYTMVFSTDAYRLYGSTGLLSEGSVETTLDKRLMFADTSLRGNYRGNAFEEPVLELNYAGEAMRFAPAPETVEDVYLNWLGVYEAEQEESCLPILDRWFEFYFYNGGTLLRGNYEIYANGDVKFTALDGSMIHGTVRENQRFALELPDGEMIFAAAHADRSYKAAHAMGEYTLRTYDGEVFTIHGVDGFLKALGEIEFSGAGGTVCYFPRRITGEAEMDDRFTFDFTEANGSLMFPASTYLLPRSGNIDSDTGYGSYWSAGTELEFVAQDQSSVAYVVEYEARTAPWRQEDIPLEAVISSGEGLLSQSMPSIGTAKPLVLLVDFPDQHRPRFVTAEAMQQALFSLDYDESLSAYYYRSSYGNLTIDGTVLDWYRTIKNRGDYSSDKEIIAEVIQYHIRENGLQLSDYDADADGEVDSLYVLWAGNMDASSGMWSSAYRSSWRNSPEEWGTKVQGYIFVPGTTVWSSVPPLKCNTNSLTHETGHLLGLNDYYSYDTTDRSDADAVYTGGALEGGLGGMDMMDVNMGDHNAFSKYLLGWLQPEIVLYDEILDLAQQEQTFILHPSNEQPEALFIQMKGTENLFTELLVVEVISPTMNASEFTRLKEPMVRILHVDASMNEPELQGNWRGYGFRYDNSYTSTKFISMVEADGRDTVLNHVPQTTGNKLSYDVQDCFAAGDVLTPASYPSTNGYDVWGNTTVYTGLTIAVESISENGEAIIRLGYAPQEDTFRIESVTPEPVVVPDTAASASVSDADEIIVTFDREIALDEDAIRLISGNAILDGCQVCVEGRNVRIVLDASVKAAGACTLVIPQGCVWSRDDGNILNNCNYIFGFIFE